MSKQKAPLHLGELLRQLRKEKNLSVTIAAAMLRIDIAILSKMERGERRINKDLIPKFAHLYECDERKLLIEYLSDEITYLLSHQSLAPEILNKARLKIKNRMHFRRFLSY